MASSVAAMLVSFWMTLRQLPGSGALRLRYELKPELSALRVASLRERVGWDPREDRYDKILGSTYRWAGCFAASRLIGYVDVVSDGVDDAFVRDLMFTPGTGA